MYQLRIRRTDEQIEAALRQAGGNQAGAARMLQITRQSVQERVQRSPHLQRACKHIEEFVLDTAESALLQHIREGNLEAVQFFLERRGGGKWARRTYTSLDPTKLSDAELKSAIAELEKIVARPKRVAPVEPVASKPLIKRPREISKT